MAFWLLKTEPGDFSYDDLSQRDRERWDGVKNFNAIRNLGRMVPGEHVFIYHTGQEKAIVGVAEVVSSPYPDPKASDPRWLVIDITARYRLQRVVTLKTVKALSEFSEWELVKQPRLSVMPVKAAFWEAIHRLGETPILL